MDHDLEQLHEKSRNILIDTQLQFKGNSLPEGFGKSDEKRVRKAISNLDWDTEAYGNIMENALSSPNPAKSLQTGIRGVESRTMAAWQLTPGDTIHHLIQQRMGGNFSLFTEGGVVRAGVENLQDMFGMRFSQSTGPNGVIRGDTSLSNWAHKADTKGKGPEFASGIGTNPDISTTAHRFGTGGIYTKTPKPSDVADSESFVRTFAPLIQSQLDDLEVGLKTDAPRVEAIRSLDPGLARAYMKDNTLEEIQEMQKILKRPELQDSIIDSYRLLPSGGTIKTLTRIGTAVPLLGFAGGIGQAAAAAQQGDYAGAVAHTAGAIVGEVPVIGDVINETVSGSAVASGELKDAPRIKMGPKNVAAPTGDKKWDNTAQPFIQMLNGKTPKPKFKQTAIPALNF